MTPRQIMLVQATFEQLRARSLVIGERFYRRLFGRYPEMRDLFSGDIQAQAGKLMNMVAVMVESLEHPVDAADTLFELGIRHQAYGVQPRHYRAAGRIFLWAIKPAGKKGFTPEVRQAWMAFYDMLVEYMLAVPHQQRRIRD